MRLPRLRTIVYTFLVFLVLLWGAVFLLLQSDAFWQWAGPRLVQMVNGRIRGTLTVQKITGNPFSGYYFRNVELTSPEGKIFQARELELRLSFPSLLALRPSLRLALVKPSLDLKQDQQGRWNVAKLLPPSQSPGGEIWLPISAFHLDPLLLKGGEITVSQPGGSQRFSDLNLELAVTLSEPLTDRQSLEVKKIALAAATPWGPYNLAGKFTISHHRVQVDSFTLTSGKSRLLSLSGMVPLADGKKKLKVTGDLGPIPGEIVAWFSPKWLPAWAAGGELKITGTWSKVQVNLRGKVHQAAFSLTGRLSRVRETWHYDLGLQLKDVPPQMLAALDASQAKELEQATPLNARLTLKGSGLGWPPRQFAWDLRLEPLTYRRIKLEEGRVTLAGTDKQQKLEGSLKGNFGKVSLRAQGSFLRTPQGEINLQVEEFQPGLFDPGVPEGSLFTGKFTGKVAVPDLNQPERVSLAGEVQAAGQLGGHPLGELRGRFAWAQPRLTIQELRVQWGNLRADLQGTLDGERLNISHRGRTLPGGDWPVPASLGGSLSWDGRITGSLQEPAYALQLNGRNLSWGKFDLKTLTLKANGQGLPPRAGTVELRAKGVRTPAGAFAQVNFTGRGGRAQWQFSLQAASPPKKRQVEMAGTADFSSRPLALLVKRFRVRLRGVDAANQGPVQVKFLPGLELAPSTFLINHGTVTAQANLQEGQISALLTVKDLPVELTRVKGLHGKIQARLSLEGAAASPQMAGEISIVKAKWQEFGFQSFKTTLSYSGTSLAVTGGLQESAKGGRLSWTGRLPLRFSLQPFKFALLDEDLEFMLRGDGANLAMLTIFTQEVQQAEAPLDLQVEVKGRLSKPLVNGKLSWGAGQITLRQAGAAYHLLPGSIRWQNDRVTLPQLTLKSKGTAILTADISLAGLKPQKVTAQASLNDFKALDKLGSDSYINGVANLSGPWSALVLQGRFNIPRASLNPALLKQGGTELPADYVLVGVPKAKKAGEIPLPDPYRKMKIAVTLEASKDVRVMDKMAQIELALAIWIKKRPGGPLLVGGTVRSLEGTIDVYGKTFTLERGLVTLPGVPGQEPFVLARAVHQMTDATFIVNVSGPVNNPKIDLSSSPAMPPNDLLSYLIFDRPTSGLNKQEFDVTQQAVGVLGGITARKIQEFLGKDFPVLGDVSMRSAPGTIGITKPLTKGVTLSVERKLNPAQGDNPVQLRLQYRINRHFSLEAEGGQSRSGADALFNYEW
ncbi:MAG: translocation/assembly module TamB domain-containing protein [Syntrophales bacterium]|nr:translocation/assembly module TamB domain-containing protein [Syntrophales bacterium]